MNMRKTQLKWLAVLAAILLMGTVAFEQTAKWEAVPDYDQKMAAARLTQRAFDLIREEREHVGPAIDPTTDINRTGLVGDGYTAITTTLGNLEAKRSTCNPNIAAMIVDLFIQAGVVQGTCVAVNLSGSFPAVNIAVLCALEAMGVESYVLSSIGASSYGANLPQFTYPDMEKLIVDAGIISRGSQFVSIGGQNDTGADIDAAVRSEIIKRLEEKGYKILHIENLDANIRYRYGLYQEFGEIGCLVNVGGNAVSFGNSDLMMYTGGGVLTGLPDGYADTTGLVQLFMNEEIPVVNILNIKELLIRCGIPIDPIPIPAAGEGGVYYHRAYNYGIAAFTLIVSMLILVQMYRSNRRRGQLTNCKVVQ